MIVYRGSKALTDLYKGNRPLAQWYRGYVGLIGQQPVTPSTVLKFKPATNITLSNGDRTATATIGGSELQPVNTDLILIGKRYFEVTITYMGYQDSSQGIGISAGDKDESTPYFAVFSPEDSGGAYIIINGDFTDQIQAGVNWSSGYVIQIAYDSVAQTVMVGVNNTWSPPYSTSSVGTNLKPWCNIVRQFNQFTINGGDTAFVYDPPSGYVAAVAA